MNKMKGYYLSSDWKTSFHTTLLLSKYKRFLYAEAIQSQVKYTSLAWYLLYNRYIVNDIRYTYDVNYIYEGDIMNFRYGRKVYDNVEFLLYYLKLILDYNISYDFVLRIKEKKNQTWYVIQVLLQRKVTSIEVYLYVVRETW